MIITFCTINRIIEFLFKTFWFMFLIFCQISLKREHTQVHNVNNAHKYKFGYLFCNIINCNYHFNAIFIYTYMYLYV